MMLKVLCFRYPRSKHAVRRDVTFARAFRVRVIIRTLGS